MFKLLFDVIFSEGLRLYLFLIVSRYDYDLLALSILFSVAVGFLLMAILAVLAISGDICVCHFFILEGFISLSRFLKVLNPR